MDASITPVGQLPAQVRADGAEGRKLWEASLGFESLLVRTLTASMTSSISGGGDDEETDASTATAREQLPDALTNAISANGGLGLAEQLYTAMRPEAIK